MKKINALLLTILLLMVLFVSTCVLAGCTSTKQVSKSSTNVDSSAIKERDEEIRILKAENERLNIEIRELQFAEVRFDTVFVKGDTVVNTVVITKDGEVQAKGNIVSAVVSKNILTKIVNEKQRVIDSLSKALTSEKANVKKVVEVKEKEVKRSVFPGWMWWLLLIAFGGGYYVRGRFGNIFK